MSGGNPSDCTLSCSDVSETLDYYLDDELGERERAELDAHLARCCGCRKELATRRGIRRCVRESSAKIAMPEEFRARMCDAIRATEPVSCPVQKRWDRLRVDARAVVIAASALLVAGLSAALILGESSPLAGERFQALVGPDQEAAEEGRVLGVASAYGPVVDEAVAWHRRNLPLEVVGPDVERVRDWFTDKVDFAVQVPTFGAGGANLLGGRLGKVERSDAAYLVYEVDGRKLSVMLFRDPDGAAEEARPVFVDNSTGYQVAVGQAGQLLFTVTSDLPRDRVVSLASTLGAPGR